MYTFWLKNFGRAKVPLKLLASDRNTLIRLRIRLGWPETSLGVNVI